MGFKNYFIGRMLYFVFSVKSLSYVTITVISAGKYAECNGGCNVRLSCITALKDHLLHLSNSTCVSIENDKSCSFY